MNYAVDTARRAQAYIDLERVLAEFERRFPDSSSGTASTPAAGGPYPGTRDEAG
ncbi:hypothetical protein GCM10023085_41940 [Actinomadura viridis]